jgi:hypothetical protein
MDQGTPNTLNTKPDQWAHATTSSTYVNPVHPKIHTPTITYHSLQQGSRTDKSFNDPTIKNLAFTI